MLAARNTARRKNVDVEVDVDVDVDEIRRGLLASGRVDYLASVLPTLRLCWFFLVFCAPSKKLRDLPPVVVCGPSKRRTDLRTRLSKAKYRQEADFDVKTSLAPPKSAENYEKPKKQIRKNIFAEKCFRKFLFGVNKSKVANRPKRVLPKFRADPSHVRRVRGRLGGIREA